MRTTSKFFVTIITPFILLVPINSLATPASLNQTMTNIALTIEPLFPLIFSEEKFEKKKNKSTIQKSTDKLIVLFKEAKPHFSVKSPTYRISYDIIQDQLDDTKSALKSNNLSYARSIFKEFVAICTSCHTQDVKLRSLFSGVKRSEFDNDLQYAEFNYMTRDYSDATKYYEKFLTSKAKIPEHTLMTAFQRVITIYTQVKNEPAKAKKILSKYVNHKSHTKFSKVNLESWLNGLTELEQKKASELTLNSFDQFKPYIKEVLGPLNEAGAADFPSKKEKISRVWLRGQLYHYLNTMPPKEEIPQLLYWLAIIDRSLSYSFFYSLSDMYLEECILKYSDHPFAKKCYDEYESYVTFSFSGSRGTDIPEDIKQELQYLKNHIDRHKMN